MTVQFKLAPLITSRFLLQDLPFCTRDGFYSPGPSLSSPVPHLSISCLFYIALCIPMFKVSAVMPGHCPSAQSQILSQIRQEHKYFIMCRITSCYCILQRKCILYKEKQRVNQIRHNHPIFRKNKQPVFYRQKIAKNKLLTSQYKINPSKTDSPHP